MNFYLYKLYNGKHTAAAHRKMFREMPDVPGYEKVYAQYGISGGGFYYMGEGGRVVIKTGHFTITEAGAKKMLDEIYKLLPE
jgi:hypothetical protein